MKVLEERQPSVVHLSGVRGCWALEALGVGATVLGNAHGVVPLPVEDLAAVGASLGVCLGGWEVLVVVHVVSISLASFVSDEKWMMRVEGEVKGESF